MNQIFIVLLAILQLTISNEIPSDLTAEQILIRSGNIGSVRIGQKIGEEKFFMLTRCLISMAVGTLIAFSPLRDSRLVQVLIDLTGG